eukprot:scaffold11663_cov179-Ochromonas_danica.AAC.3
MEEKRRPLEAQLALSNKGKSNRKRNKREQLHATIRNRVIKEAADQCLLLWHDERCHNNAA